MAHQRYRVECRLAYQVHEPSTFIFNIAPARTRYQRIIGERLELDPELAANEHIDRFMGNRFHRVAAPKTTFSIHYTADVDCTPRLRNPARITASAPDRLSLSMLPYLYPSRYCQSDLLGRLAQREFGHIESGYDKVMAICDWTYRNVDYLSGSTNERISAHDTAISRFGVCRDFTHLAIAFCRALNMPARFVSGYGYKLPKPDFHAAFEVFLGGRWYLFDPTRMVSSAHFVRIGTGRDAADVSFAFIFGRFSLLDMSVSCIAPEDVEYAPTDRAVVSS